MRITKLFSLCALLLILVVATASAKGTYKIRIKVNGVKDSMCYLGYYFGDKQYLRDSVVANSKGEFTFKSDTTSLPAGIYLVVLPGKRYFELLVDKDQDFSVETDMAYLDDYSKYKTTGSDDNDRFFKYTVFANGCGKKMEVFKNLMNKAKSSGDSAMEKIDRDSITAIEKSMQDFKKDFIKNHPGDLLSVIFKAMFEPEIPEIPVLENGRPDSTFRYRYYKAHFWDNIDFNDDRIIRTPIFHGKLKTYMQNLTVQIPDSINQSADLIIEKARPSKELFKYCIWYVTYTYETSDIMGMDAVFVHMADTYYATHQAFWVDDATQFKITDRANTLRPLLLGKKAPNLIMRELHGEFKSLHDVKAPYTVAIFWDPDCGHCKKAMPVLDSLYKAYLKPQGIEVYAICAEYELEKWRAYVKEHDLQWINVADSTYTIPFKKLYDVTSTPVIYILDDKKEIVAKKISVQQVGEIIENRNKAKRKKEGEVIKSSNEVKSNK